MSGVLEGIFSFLGLEEIEFTYVVVCSFTYAKRLSASTLSGALAFGAILINATIRCNFKS